jgi:hypothetical protein
MIARVYTELCIIATNVGGGFIVAARVMLNITNPKLRLTARIRLSDSDPQG